MNSGMEDVREVVNHLRSTAIALIALTGLSLVIASVALVNSIN